MSPADPGPSEREIEELLRRLPPERPDAERKHEARRAFLAAGEPGSGAAERVSRAFPGARMPEVSPGDPEELAAFEAWLAQRSPAAPPGEAARQRARLAFLSSIAATPAPRRTRRSFRSLVLVLAAAAILAVTFLLPEPVRWRAELGGALELAGGEYGPGDEDRLAVALEGAGALSTRGARARFTLADVLDLEVLASTKLDFPPLPELDGVTTLHFDLHLGEAFVRTRAGYPGNPLVVHTAQVDVLLHGTTVGVLVDEGGTCVCVAEGTARVQGPGLAERALTDRSILRVFADPALEPSLQAFPLEAGDPEAAHVRELVDFLRAP